MSYLLGIVSSSSCDICVFTHTILHHIHVACLLSRGGGFESTKQEQDGDLTITKAEKKEDNRSTTRKTKDSCLEKVDNNPPLYTSDEETNERVTQGGN